MHLKVKILKLIPRMGFEDLAKYTAVLGRMKLIYVKEFKRILERFSAFSL
jgi:hypothetical protein